MYFIRKQLLHCMQQDQSKTYLPAVSMQLHCMQILPVALQKWMLSILSHTSFWKCFLKNVLAKSLNLFPETGNCNLAIDNQGAWVILRNFFAFTINFCALFFSRLQICQCLFHHLLMVVLNKAKPCVLCYQVTLLLQVMIVRYALHVSFIDAIRSANAHV